MVVLFLLLGGTSILFSIVSAPIYIPTNGRDLRETEDIKKRWQEDTEELYKKGLNEPDNHDNCSLRVRLPEV